MAGFNSHITVSSALGVGYGVAGYACGLPPTTAAVGVCLCAIGGMLPDLDGDTGVAVREIVPIVAAAVPILLLDVFQQWGYDRESIFLSIVILYFFIRFGIGEPFKRFTRHRGMWHSIPAAINCGLLTFVICSYQHLEPRLFKSVAITIGFLSHLILDEIWSMGWLRSKQSAGTAFKMFGLKKMWPNFLTYGILVGMVSYIWICDARFRRDFQAWRNGDLKLHFTPQWSRFSGSGKGESIGEAKVEPGIVETREVEVAKPGLIEPSPDPSQVE